MRALQRAPAPAPRSGSLRLEPRILEDGDVLAVRVRERLDVGTDLLRHVVGKLGERLGLLLQLVVGSSGRRGERLADAEIRGNEALAVLVGEVEVRVGVGARVPPRLVP